MQTAKAFLRVGDESTVNIAWSGIEFGSSRIKTSIDTYCN